MAISCSWRRRFGSSVSPTRRYCLRTNYQRYLNMLLRAIGLSRKLKIDWHTERQTISTPPTDTSCAWDLISRLPYRLLRKKQPNFPDLVFLRFLQAIGAPELVNTEGPFVGGHHQAQWGHRIAVLFCRGELWFFPTFHLQIVHRVSCNDFRIPLNSPPCI